ncbi:hypothetical protein IQ264_15815 [Phormidium sp. LEGE 05292]|uniref:hypothetical protein n=1 Tax=[Phormidium] sp. LEGE 05292 TaxID=767427 RepID=UPI0018805474|nr:hypothetical protein [Phormidium sp. LEGE 05292]MBE9226894.1 hypothetical protein [Phormidium sp. LEGE 05292]
MVITLLIAHPTTVNYQLIPLNTLIEQVFPKVQCVRWYIFAQEALTASVSMLAQN